MYSGYSDALRNNLCVIAGAIALIGAFSVQASDSTTREDAIRANSIGTGVADKRIEEDRANRDLISRHSEVGNVTNFLNNVKARQQQRAAAIDAEDAARRKNMGGLIAAYREANISNSEELEVPARKPLNPEIPHAGWNAYLILERCIKEHGDSAKTPYPRESFPCYLAKAKFGLGLNNIQAYEPDPKEGFKMMKALLKDDVKQFRDREENPSWKVYAPEIYFYMGEATFVGAEFPRSKIKQDYSEAREYFEQSISSYKGTLVYSGDRGTPNNYSTDYIIDSYFRLIEIYGLGIGTEKNPARAQQLAQEIVTRTGVVAGKDYDLTSRPEWEQVKDIVSPHIK